jgi:hypothetical protein
MTRHVTNTLKQPLRSYLGRERQMTMSGNKNRIKSRMEAGTKRGFIGMGCLTRAGTLGYVVGKLKSMAEKMTVNKTKPALSHARKTILLSRFSAAQRLLLLGYLLLPAELRAGGPTDQVRATVDKVLTIVRTANPKSKTQMVKQRAQLVEVIYPRFDFQEMAKRSLGPHWARRTAEEQREFVGIFAALMGRAYADNIESLPIKASSTRARKRTKTTRKWTPRLSRRTVLPLPSITNFTASTRSGKFTTWSLKTLAWSITTDLNSIASLHGLRSRISFVR